MCKINDEQVGESESIPLSSAEKSVMKLDKLKYLLHALFIATSTFSNAQDFVQCIIYQFAGTDSINKHISLTQQFNLEGLIVSELYENYKSNSREGHSDGLYNYIYKDTLLMERTFHSLDYDTTKVVYYYNTDNQCVREEHYTYKKSPINDITQDNKVIDDTEQYRTWTQTNEVALSYDDKGRQIKRKDGQDYDVIYEYDEQNRIINELGFTDNLLAYERNYRYFTDGHSYTTVYYDRHGNPEPPEYSDSIFNPIYTTIVYLDTKGRIIRENVITENGIQISNKLIYYDTTGRIERTFHQYIDERFIRINEPVGITHIFEYK